MISKQAFLKGLLSVLLCAIVNALVLGLYDIQKESHVIRAYLEGVFIAFIYITVFCYWLLYIPALALFGATTKYIDRESFTAYIFLGIGVSLVSGLFFLMLDAYTIGGFWRTFPSAQVLKALPAFGFIGSVYGYVPPMANGLTVSY